MIQAHTLHPLFGTKILDSKQQVCAKHNSHYLISLFVLQDENRWIGRCDKCQKEKEDAEIKQMLLQREQERKKREMCRLFDRAAIPPKFTDKTFANYIDNTSDKKHVKNTMLEFAKNIDMHMRTGRNIILSGNIGNGKNHLAIAAAKVAMEHGYTVLFSRARSMIGEINAAGWKKEEEIKKYAIPDLLILDEVKYGFNHIEQDHLSSVIEDRYNLGKSTIILTNLSVEKKELHEVLGDRVISRLRENGCYVLYFTWEDYRLKLGCNSE